MQDAGMSIREDAMGNIWARWKGADADVGESSRTTALMTTASVLLARCTIVHAPGNHYHKHYVEARSVQNCSKMSMVKHTGHEALQAP